MSDSTPHDDGLTEPLEGAVEASTAEGTSPAVGRDEWVARHGERRQRREGWLGKVEERLSVVPWWAWLALFVGLVCLLPIPFESGYVRRVAFDTVVYMLLALGLNIVVGWGGLLDLGFVAFYGIGAYTYALLASDQYDIHLPTIVIIPLAVLVGAIAGWLVGLPSKRLSGDYLAIVTLFFFQVFLTFTNNGDDVFGESVTNGPNGILNVDELSFFGWTLPRGTSEGLFNIVYLYVALVFFVVVFVALRLLNDSRTGRAWRSLREDSLAAEMMGMPVNTLKLMAFAFGAGVAALTGTFVTALNGSVFPQNFEFPLLITVYTMVILGGAGSQVGVVVGAITVSVLLEVLREPGDARALFYIVILLGLVAAFRVSLKLVVVLGGTVLLGVIVRLVADGIDDTWTAGVSEDSGRLAHWAADWVVVPANLAGWLGPVSYITLIVLALALTLVHGWVRIGLLVPTLYLAAFVWENVMLDSPETTRYIVLGALLVAMMIARPSGLLGEKRVEIV
ncbi:MAG TPA: branched-chain amino acid ABC transporter permease [Gaiellaceae bacterium]|nr:branched-chain amino acid ABC transporter permease [Gaiellaceae bacterium]